MGKSFEQVNINRGEPREGEEASKEESVEELLSQLKDLGEETMDSEVSKIDFDGLLSRLKDLREKAMDRGEVHRMISDLREHCPENKIDNSSPESWQRKLVSNIVNNPVLQNIQERVIEKYGQKENFTPFLDVLKSFHLMNGVIAELSSTAGYRSRFSDKITLAKETLPFDDFDIVENFALFGCHKSITMLHHEKIHSYQWDNPKDEIKKCFKEFKELLGLLAGTLSLAVVSLLAGPEVLFSFAIARNIVRPKVNQKYTKIFNKAILRETQGFFGAGRLGYKDESKEKLYSFFDILAFLKGYKPHVKFNKKEMDCAVASYQATKRLYTLGLSDQQIGELVKKSQWNEEKASFDVLEEKIEQLTLEKNLTEEDLNDLVLAEDIKNQIYRLDVQIIAQEEIKKAFLSIGQNLEK